MHSINVIILVAFIAQVAVTNELGDSQDSTDKFVDTWVDKLADKLFDQTLDSWPLGLQHDDPDNATLEMFDVVHRKLVNRLFDHAIKLWPLHHAKLDNITLGAIIFSDDDEDERVEDMKKKGKGKSKWAGINKQKKEERTQKKEEKEERYRKKPKKIFNATEKRLQDDERVMFVGNVPLMWTEWDLQKLIKALCDSPGENEKESRLEGAADNIDKIWFRDTPVEIDHDKVSGGKKADDFFTKNAYVRLQNQEEVRTMRMILDGYVIDDKHTLRADGLGNNAQKLFGRKTSVYVSWLSEFTSEHDLRKLFESVGTVSGVRVIRDFQTKECAGYGYVRFVEPEAVRKALALKGTELLGRRINVVRITNKGEDEARSKELTEKWAKVRKMLEELMTEDNKGRILKMSDHSFENLIRKQGPPARIRDIRTVVDHLVDKTRREKWLEKRLQRGYFLHPDHQYGEEKKEKKGKLLGLEYQGPGKPLVKPGETTTPGTRERRRAQLEQKKEQREKVRKERR